MFRSTIAMERQFKSKPPGYAPDLKNDLLKKTTTPKTGVQPEISRFLSLENKRISNRKTIKFQEGPGSDLLWDLSAPRWSQGKIMFLVSNFGFPVIF